ncbi:uncharacterized protein G2W53_003610 [Senna tora]|uniref:Uncharacterized protein n=1 Tax=Senna tora TaxID=362788 RepID=A0A834XBE4_9FABA|nr:uncharacterized protein G2W53_003610 [Senna tora]
MGLTLSATTTVQVKVPLYIFSTMENPHCFREANCSADALANQGRRNNLCKAIFHQPPTFLLPHILHDQQQTQIPCSINIRADRPTCQD